jgi:hypothetical protein
MTTVFCTGKALCLLKRSDFMERVPKNGDLLYNALTKLVQKNSGELRPHWKLSVFSQNSSSSPDIYSEKFTSIFIY